MRIYHSRDVKSNLLDDTPYMAAARSGRVDRRPELCPVARDRATREGRVARGESGSGYGAVGRG
jgi:hypothetical protein